MTKEEIVKNISFLCTRDTKIKHLSLDNPKNSMFLKYMDHKNPTIRYNEDGSISYVYNVGISVDYITFIDNEYCYLMRNAYKIKNIILRDIIIEFNRIIRRNLYSCNRCGRIELKIMNKLLFLDIEYIDLLDETVIVDVNEYDTENRYCLLEKYYLSLCILYYNNRDKLKYYFDIFLKYRCEERIDMYIRYISWLICKYKEKSIPLLNIIKQLDREILPLVKIC